MQKCEPAIFQNGTPILQVTGGSSTEIEGFVQRLAAATSSKTDWHYLGGRGCVKTLGDPRHVQRQSLSLETALQVRAIRLK